MRDPLSEIFALAGSSGFGDPGGVSTYWSKGCWKFFRTMGCSDDSCGSREDV